MLPYAEYYFNQDQIIAQHCINLDRPELKCNGQCYLMQRLREMQAEEAPPSSQELPPVLSVEEVLAVHLICKKTTYLKLPEQTRFPYIEQVLAQDEIHLDIPYPPPQV